MFMFFSCGGPEGVRTLGLCVANAALSQLSYGPKYKAQNPAGTEPLNAEPALKIHNNPNA